MAEPDWKSAGQLPDRARPTALFASPGGGGLVGVTVEPKEGPLLERMRQRRSRILRLEGQQLEAAYEGPGWIQAIDAVGDDVLAVEATLAESGEGSDYRLLFSADGGKTFQSGGAVEVPSVVQLACTSAGHGWVLGAGVFARTSDAGRSWSRVSVEGERRPHTERLRRYDSGIALISPELVQLSQDGERWIREPHPGVALRDCTEHWAVAKDHGHLRVARHLGSELEWTTPLPEASDFANLTSEGPDLVRVVTRIASPVGGFAATLHRSEDAGDTWRSTPLTGVGPWLQIAGGRGGLGVTVRGEVRCTVHP